jgi:hypothetical protein
MKPAVVFEGKDGFLCVFAVGAAGGLDFLVREAEVDCSVVQLPLNELRELHAYLTDYLRES